MFSGRQFQPGPKDFTGDLLRGFRIHQVDEDYQYSLDNLSEWKGKLGCKVYAYYLMTNHVHLIVNPGEDGENLARLMKRVAGRQTRYLNRLEKRTGSLWEGRFKSSEAS